MVLSDEEKYPGEVVKIVSSEIKVRVILRGCPTPLGLCAEIKFERSLFKVLSHTWHIINTRCISPCLLCILKLKSYNLLFSRRWKWCTQFLEWKSSGSGPRKWTKVHPKSDCTTNPTGMWQKNRGKIFHSWKRSLGLIFMVKNILGLVLCFVDLYTWYKENVSHMGQFGWDL